MKVQKVQIIKINETDYLFNQLDGTKHCIRQVMNRFHVQRLYGDPITL